MVASSGRRLAALAVSSSATQRLAVAVTETVLVRTPSR
jgi:hypothetical protein